MEFEFIKEAVKKESRSMYVPVIEQWYETDNRTLKFKCKNDTEYKSCTSAVNTYRRNHGLDFTVFQKKANLEVYLVRA